MKIILNNEEYDKLKEILTFVDSRSYDPVYKNMCERFEKMKQKEENGINVVVALEESDVFNVFDAMDDYFQSMEKVNISDKEKEDNIKSAKDLLLVIEEETGMSS